MLNLLNKKYISVAAKSLSSKHMSFLCLYSVCQMHKKQKIPMLKHKKQQTAVTVIPSVILKGKNMTIPSSLLIQEIMHYEGYSPKPVLNRVGMPCIGYGFPLWEEGLHILHGNTKLAQCIKNSMPKDKENAGLGLQRILQLELAVSEEKARQLLTQSLLYYAEELGKNFAGFRRLVNLCSQCSQSSNAVIFPESSLAEYEKRLLVQNQYAHEKKENLKNIKQKDKGTTAQNNAQNPCCFSKPTGSLQALHPAFLESFYSSSSAFAGANPFRQYHYFSSPQKQRKQKKGKFLPYLALTSDEQALLRVDSVLFAAHLLGLEITLQMHDFFLALQQDNYAEAANQLLSHSASAYLGAVIAILARRIHDASLDFQDIALQKADVPKMQFHRRKIKNYFTQYVLRRRKIFAHTEHYGQLHEQAGVCHA